MPRLLPNANPMQHSCSPYNAFRAITSQTYRYLRTWQHQMTTIMQPFHCDLQPQIPKHPMTMHAQAHPKQLEATVTMRQKRANRPQPQPPHTGGTFHRRLQPLDTEKHKFLCPGFLPNANPMQHSCSPYNAFRAITSQTCTYLRTWQHQMTTIMQPFQCDLQPQIPKHPMTMHAQAHPKQLEATVTMRQKRANRPQPQPPHTGGTFHRRLQPLDTEKHKFLCPGFLPNANPMNVLLCSVKSHTALHQGLFFCDVSLCSVKSHTALHQGHFFCDVLLCSVKPHTHTPPFINVYSFVMYCYVM